MGSPALSLSFSLFSSSFRPPSLLLLLTASASDSGTRRISRPRATSCFGRVEEEKREKEKEKGVRHGFRHEVRTALRADPRFVFRACASVSSFRAYGALHQQPYTYLVGHDEKKRKKRRRATSARGSPATPRQRPAMLVCVDLFASAFFPFIFLFFSRCPLFVRERQREGYRLLSRSARQDNPIGA